MPDFGFGRGDYDYVHLLGDSFLNGHGVLKAFRSRLTGTAGSIAGFGQDGVGGSSLSDQAVRYSETHPGFADRTLVIVEMGLDGNYAQWSAAMGIILTHINHDRWLVCEPAPQIANGAQARTYWDTLVANIAAYCDGYVDTGGRMISTLTEALALSDGSPEDEAKVADRLWPVSLTVSASDFHPNAAGDDFLGERIYNALVLKGWAA